VVVRYGRFEVFDGLGEIPGVDIDCGRISGMSMALTRVSVPKLQKTAFQAQIGRLVIRVAWPHFPR
jgi:hypothetical protein